MTKAQFMEQFARLSNEWPRAYGASKAEMFAKEFAGHEYGFFREVVDNLLRKFRYAPQVTDVWSMISEVSSKRFKRPENKIMPQRFSSTRGPDILPPAENRRRFKLLYQFMGDRELQQRDPDWLRRNIWPNETKQESEKKYGKIMLEDAISRKAIT